MWASHWASLRAALDHSVHAGEQSPGDGRAPSCLTNGCAWLSSTDLMLRELSWRTNLNNLSKVHKSLPRLGPGQAPCRLSVPPGAAAAGSHCSRSAFTSMHQTRLLLRKDAPAFVWNSFSRLLRTPLQPQRPWPGGWRSAAPRPLPLFQIGAARASDKPLSPQGRDLRPAPLRGNRSPRRVSRRAPQRQLLFLRMHPGEPQLRAA